MSKARNLSTLLASDGQIEDSRIDSIAASKLSGTLPASAGAVLLSNTTVAGLGIVVDEDNMASNLSTKIPTQQSVKTYVNAQVGALETSLTHFHSATQDVTSAQGTTNVTATVAFTFSELSTAKYYAAYLNRLILRPAEYTVSGTTVTVAIGVLDADDEIEITGFSS